MNFYHGYFWQDSIFIQRKKQSPWDDSLKLTESWRKIPHNETLNLSTCVDSSTNTKILCPPHKKQIRCQVLGFRWHICHLSHVTNANSQSHWPPPLLTPPLCTAGWFAKTHKSTFFPQDNFRQILCKKLYFSETKTKHIHFMAQHKTFHNTRTSQLLDWIGLGPKSVKILHAQYAKSINVCR